LAVVKLRGGWDIKFFRLCRPAKESQAKKSKRLKAFVMKKTVQQKGGKQIKIFKQDRL
jgi:hypothetical protein